MMKIILRMIKIKIKYFSLAFFIGLIVGCQRPEPTPGGIEMIVKRHIAPDIPGYSSYPEPAERINPVQDYNIKQP